MLDFAQMFYTTYMTALLEQAISRLRRLSPAEQHTAARVLISQLEEEPQSGDHAAITEGREAFARGDFTTLKDWRHEVGLGDN